MGGLQFLVSSRVGFATCLVCFLFAECAGAAASKSRSPELTFATLKVERECAQDWRGGGTHSPLVPPPLSLSLSKDKARNVLDVSPRSRFEGCFIAVASIRTQNPQHAAPTTQNHTMLTVELRLTRSFAKRWSMSAHSMMRASSTSSTRDDPWYTSRHSSR